MSLLMTFASALAVNYNLTTFQPDETLTDDQLVEIDTISNGAELTLKIRINGVKVELANPEDSTYSIRLPKFGVATAKGSADVPKGLFYLPVPNGYNHVRIKSVSVDSVSHRINIKPAQTFVPGENIGVQHPIAAKQVLVELANNGQLLNRNEIGVIISPVGYNPNTGKAVFSKEILAEFSLDEITNDYFTRERQQTILSDKQKSYLSLLSSNGAQVSNPEVLNINFPWYIIIVPNDNYYSGARLLKDWKQQLGYNTFVIRNSDLTYLEENYSKDLPLEVCRFIVGGLLGGDNMWRKEVSPEMIKAVLFGTTNDIRPHTYQFDDFVGQNHEYPSSYQSISSDMYGATCVDVSDENTDLEPEVSVGRIPCNSLAQSLLAALRVKNYEMNLISENFEPKNVMHLCTEFLDENRDNCEDMRWVETVAQWPNRIDPYVDFDFPYLFAKEDGVAPLYWNSSEFGGKLYYNIRDADWTSNATNIVSAFPLSDYILFMGRSDVNRGWKLPNFAPNDVKSIATNAHFPVVLSISSLTGKMEQSTDLMPQLLFGAQGGMAGGIAPSGPIMPSYYHLIMDALLGSQWSRDIIGYYYPHPENKYNNVFLGDWNRAIGKFLNIYYPDYMYSYNRQTAMLMHTVGDPALLLPNAPRLNATVSVSTTRNGRCSIQVANADKDYGIIVSSNNGVIASAYGTSLSTDIPQGEEVSVCVNDFVSVPRMFRISNGLAVAESPITLTVKGSSNLNSAEGFSYQGVTSDSNASIYVTNMQGTFFRQYECDEDNEKWINFTDYPNGIFKAILIGDNGKSESITLYK